MLGGGKKNLKSITQKNAIKKKYIKKLHNFLRFKNNFKNNLQEPPLFPKDQKKNKA